MELEGGTGTSSCYILKLRKYLYGLKQASLNWHNNNMLKAALLDRDRGFVESTYIRPICMSENSVLVPLPIATSK